MLAWQLLLDHSPGITLLHAVRLTNSNLITSCISAALHSD
jgi:hypothetical protein